jgi:hypothetical protein
MPPSDAAVAMSPKLKYFSSTSQSVPLVVVNPIKPWWVQWSICGPDGNTNMPYPNVEFDLEKRDSIDGAWYLFCRTNQPPVPFNFDNEQGYFRVGSHWIVEP